MINTTKVTETLDDFSQAVLEGLALPQKQISSKFVHDQDSTDDDLSPDELEILRDHAEKIAPYFSECILFEFGGSEGEKSRLLLEKTQNLEAYFPLDVSQKALLSLDFTKTLEGSASLTPPYIRRSAFLPGSIIRKCEPTAVLNFLRGLREFLGEGGRLALGVDLIKSLRMMELAYNDSDGVTALFSLNLLNRINAELGGNFNLREFKHEAFFNTDLGRMENHLVSLRPQEIRILGRKFRFKENETIHTENSYRYTLEGFEDLARLAGFKVMDCWTDQKVFSAFLMLEYRNLENYS